MPADATPQPRTEQQPSQLDRFVAFAFAAADMVAELTEQGDIVFAAGAYRSHLGCPPESLIGRPVRGLVDPDDVPALEAALAVLKLRGRFTPVTLRLADRARTPFAVSGLMAAGLGGAKRLCVTFALLPGRIDTPAGPLRDARRFAGEAEARLRRVAGGPAGPGGAAERPVLRLLELTPGDEALARRAEEAGPALEAALAESLPPGGAAARLGGLRYGVLGDAEGGPDLARLGREMGKALGVTGMGFAGREIPLAAEGLSAGQAVRALRHALLSFARHGAEGLESGPEDLPRLFAGLVARSKAVRRTLANREFELLFQPIVRLEDGAVHHFEALFRPPRGLLGQDGGGGGAAEFVNLAEAVGLTEELDIAVAEKAAAAAARSPHPVAFNLSGLSVQSEAFRERLLALLDGAGAAVCARLLVELTESAEIEDEAAAAETLALVRGRGVRTCIDDFGAGGAGFRYIKAFPVDYVKIDGGFVRAAVAAAARGEGRDRALVSTMVDLARLVGAAVVAEQIETEADAAGMRSLGVRYGQGWLFGRPAPLPASLVPPVRARRHAARDPREEWA